VGESETLDAFDLGIHGDRHEQEFWPLLSGRFPEYEHLWRKLIVPLTNRIDPTAALDSWIRFRAGVPEQYQQMSMAHYSVFYFLGRAAKRFSDERERDAGIEYPEDVLFLLNSAAENFKRFMQLLNGLGKDCGVPIFDAPIGQFPRGFDPFGEINDYRNSLLHNTVMGKGIVDGKTYIPKWDPDKATSPLERTKNSWRVAEELDPRELISSVELLDRLVSECCTTLNGFWRIAVAGVSRDQFQRKMLEVTGANDFLPLREIVSRGGVQPGSGSFSSLGSNSSYPFLVARSDAPFPPNIKLEPGRKS
jgi:hypothetical protein